jgi:uncharacterized protein
MKIEVVLAASQSQASVDLELSPGATVGEAIQAAVRAGGLQPVDLERTRCGVFGKLAEPATVLHDGDRVEIYRPLTVDANDARRRRAKKRNEVAAGR